jgi:hypothetical protein
MGWFSGRKYWDAHEVYVLPMTVLLLALTIVFIVNVAELLYNIAIWGEIFLGYLFHCGSCRNSI